MTTIHFRRLFVSSADVRYNLGAHKRIGVQIHSAAVDHEYISIQQLQYRNKCNKMYYLMIQVCTTTLVILLECILKKFIKRKYGYILSKKWIHVRKLTRWQLRSCQKINEKYHNLSYFAICLLFRIVRIGDARLHLAFLEGCIGYIFFLIG